MLCSLKQVDVILSATSTYAEALTVTLVEASNMRCEDAVTIRRDDWGRRDNINNITTRGQYKYKIGNQEIKGSTVNEQHGSRSVAARSEDLYKITRNIPHAYLKGVPTDIVLEANKVEEALFEIYFFYF